MNISSIKAIYSLFQYMFLWDKTMNKEKKNENQENMKEIIENMKEIIENII